MDQKEKDRWLEAIDRCLGQKSYGCSQKCELCREADFVCENCICEEYMAYMDCEGIMADSGREYIKQHGLGWLVKPVRAELRKMRRWLVNLKVEGGEDEKQS